MSFRSITCDAGWRYTPSTARAGQVLVVRKMGLQALRLQMMLTQPQTSEGLIEVSMHRR